MTLKGVANGAGLTTSAVYNYFPSKQAVAVALLEDFRDFILSRTAHLAALDLPLMPKFILILEDSAAIYDQRPELAAFTATLLPDSVRHPELEHARRSVVRSFTDFYGGLVDQAIGRGELTPEADRDGLVNLFMGLITGMSTVASSSPVAYRHAVHALEAAITGDLILDRPRSHRASKS
jgi:AcrR family transcriptional regulator